MSAMRCLWMVALLSLTLSSHLQSTKAAGVAVQPGHSATLPGSSRERPARSHRRALRTIQPVETKVDQLQRMETVTTTIPVSEPVTPTPVTPDGPRHSASVELTPIITATAHSATESTTPQTENPTPIPTSAPRPLPTIDPTPTHDSLHSNSYDEDKVTLADFFQEGESMAAQHQETTTPTAVVSTERTPWTTVSVTPTPTVPISTTETRIDTASPTPIVDQSVTQPSQKELPKSINRTTTPTDPVIPTPTPTATTYFAQEVSTTQATVTTTYLPVVETTSDPALTTVSMSEVVDSADVQKTSTPSPIPPNPTDTVATFPTNTPTPTVPVEIPSEAVAVTQSPTPTPTTDTQQTGVITVRPDLGFLLQKSPWAALRPDARDSADGGVVDDLWAPHSQGGDASLDAGDHSIPPPEVLAAPASAEEGGRDEPNESESASWRIPVVLVMVLLIVGVAAFATHRWAWLPYQRRKRAKQYNELPAVADLAAVSGVTAAGTADAVDEGGGRVGGQAVGKGKRGKKEATKKNTSVEFESRRGVGQQRDRMSCGSDLSFMSFDIETPPDTPVSTASSSSSGSRKVDRSAKRPDSSRGGKGSPVAGRTKQENKADEGGTRAIPPPPRRSASGATGRKPPTVRKPRYKPTKPPAIEE